MGGPGGRVTIEEDITIKEQFRPQVMPAPLPYPVKPVMQAAPQAVLYSDANRDGIPDMWQGRGGFAIAGTDRNRDGIPDALQPQVRPAIGGYVGGGTLIGGTTGYVGG